ncbi:MAG: DUF1318 domain-containing protein [Pseudomonadota bacterium]|uniref:DUF1318 domain-containing protein n=1 Tax=Candidatus Desulfatibia profunda TaxID=2841695 RepID=A0A8J6NPG8_9BACT|nr:DUF1318 domain-containing protein [Candidatus Desulfatibia profunda]MBL7181025.1 DUF1318 domain-containing protein [Desulfobacterales bacterium]
MKKFYTFLWAAGMVMTTTLLACVTINIYFPAEKVESVAGDIVNDIRGKKPPQKGDQSQNHEGLFQGIRFALAPASAWADDVTTVSNPTIRALKEKMKARFQELKPYYQKGALNEGDDGYLSVADTGGLNLKEKRDLNGLVDAENSDRGTLYAEVAKALKIDPGQINRIAEIFAKEWQKPVR